MMCQTMVATVGSEKLEFARTPIKATWQQCSPSRTWCSWLSALRCWASLGMTPHSYKKTASTLLARGCLLCLFDCLQKLHEATSSPVQKGMIDTVLLYKMAAGKGQFELCSWRGGSSTKWPRFFLQFLYKHTRTCLIVFGWKFQSGCGFQRSKTVDRHYHFVGHEVPRVYGHTILQAGEVVPKPFCRQKGWLATKWTMSTPPRDPANGQEDFI